MHESFSNIGGLVLNQVTPNVLDIRPVESDRAFIDVTSQLRKLISTGRLKCGDRLPSERELSVLFNISRNTLREALRSLEIAGLIEMRKGVKGGAFIQQGNPSVIVNGFLDLYHVGAITPDQLTESRLWIDDLAIRVACLRATEEDLDALEANIVETVMAGTDGDLDRWVQVVLEFHSLLGRATHNPVLSIFMDSTVELMRQFVNAFGPVFVESVSASRRRVLRHLRARDAEGAASEMSRHLKRLHRQHLSKLAPLRPFDGEPPKADR